jgi:hypothetical protein
VYERRARRTRVEKRREALRASRGGLAELQIAESDYFAGGVVAVLESAGAAFLAFFAFFFLAGFLVAVVSLLVSAGFVSSAALALNATRQNAARAAAIVRII